MSQWGGVGVVRELRVRVIALSCVSCCIFTRSPPFCREKHLCEVGSSEGEFGVYAERALAQPHANMAHTHARTRVVAMAWLGGEPGDGEFRETVKGCRVWRLFSCCPTRVEVCSCHWHLYTLAARPRLW